MLFFLSTLEDRFLAIRSREANSCGERGGSQVALGQHASGRDSGLARPLLLQLSEVEKLAEAGHLRLQVYWGSVVRTGTGAVLNSRSCVEQREDKNLSEEKGQHRCCELFLFVL